MERDSLGLGCPQVVVMSEGQEREAARLLALVLTRNMPDRPRRSSGAMPVRLGGGMPVTTRRPVKGRDRRRGGGSGRSVKADIGGLA
jgi:hypothetical protein